MLPDQACQGRNSRAQPFIFTRQTWREIFEDKLIEDKLASLHVETRNGNMGGPKVNNSCRL